MNRYTIYCTVEQTKKALELGAPITTIKTLRSKDTFLSDDVIEYDEDTFTYVKSPTAEQMTEWLEEQGILIEFSRLFGLYAYRLMGIHRSGEKNLHLQNQNYQSHKEAILAGIDAALDYLIENKK